MSFCLLLLLVPSLNCLADGPLTLPPQNILAGRYFLPANVSLSSDRTAAFFGAVVSFAFADVTLTLPLQNILAGRYFLPANVSLSSDCKDLLARIFVVDPAARITVPEIRRHPWFSRDLPRKLATPYKPSENCALRAQAERVIKALREKRAEQTREAVKSYIV